MSKCMPPNAHDKMMRKVCPYCQAKLLFKERYERRKQEKIICSHCKEKTLGDIIVIDGKKFNRQKLQTR